MSKIFQRWSELKGERETLISERQANACLSDLMSSSPVVFCLPV